MIVVTFALPQESREFRRALRATKFAGPSSFPCWMGRLGDDEIAVAHVGVGPASAAARAESLLAAMPHARFVIASGFAGGLDARLRVGDLVVATNFSSPALLGESRAVAASRARVFFGALISQPRPAETIAEKTALASSTGALAVDMETAAIAAACRDAGIPLLAVRAISDSASEPLPVPFDEWFDLAGQGPRPLALIRFLARHPGRVRGFWRFVRGLSPARRAFTGFLGSVLESRSRAAGGEQAALS